MANPGNFFVFQTNTTIFSANQCEKCQFPSNIWCRDSNLRPLEHELSPITSRAGLLYFCQSSLTTYFASKAEIFHHIWTKLFLKKSVFGHFWTKLFFSPKIWFLRRNSFTLRLFSAKFLRKKVLCDQHFFFGGGGWRARKSGRIRSSQSVAVPFYVEITSQICWFEIIFSIKMRASYLFHSFTSSFQ